MRLDNKKTCAAYGARNAAIQRSNQVFIIEGESVTMPEIARRMGKTNKQASDRLRLLRNRPDVTAITWALLGVAK